MGKQIASDEAILRIRNKAIARLLPTIAHFYIPVRKRTASGGYTDYKPTPYLYKGSAEIPCRLDIARFFRSGNLDNQEITVNDYELHLPFDAVVQADWRIEIGAFLYEMRKDMGAATNTITRIYLITRLDTILNPIPTTPAP